jgi:hypothetical protein
MMEKALFGGPFLFASKRENTTVYRQKYCKINISRNYLVY